MALAKMSQTDFIREWRTDKTAVQIAKDNGMSVNSVFVKAQRLRKKGVVLPSKAPQKK